MFSREDVLKEQNVILFDRGHHYEGNLDQALEIYTTKIDLGSAYKIIPADWVFGIIKEGIFHYVQDSCSCGLGQRRQGVLVQKRHSRL